MTVFPHFHVIVLADDYGEKLWPIAREQAPACFAPLAPDSPQSLLSATVSSISEFTAYPIRIVTTGALRELVADEIAARTGLDASTYDVMALPVQRGSAFGIALACACARREDPDAVVAVFRADERIDADDRLESLLYRAYQVALRDRIVLVGAEQAEKPADVAYIRFGRQYANVEGAFDVRYFAADAKLSAAQRSIDEGGCWYTGIFVARAAQVLGALAYSSDSDDAPGEFGTGRIGDTAGFLALLDRSSWLRPEARELIEALPVASFEETVLEPTANLVVMPTSIRFKALNSLEDIDAHLAPDAAGNRTDGSAAIVEGRDTTVIEQTGTRSVVAYGVSGLLVVDTPDALLVADKAQARDAGTLLHELEAARLPQLTQAARRPFSWGEAVLLAVNGASATWQISLRPGASFDTLHIPAAYGMFEGPWEHFEGTLHEEYTVAQGAVRVEGYGSEAARRPVPAARSFGVDDSEAKRITCTGETGATLILTAALV